MKYPCIGLSKNGIVKTFSVHRLVLEAFIGPCPKGLQCCHGHSGSANNRLLNLSWGTQEKNNGEDKQRDNTDNRRPIIRSDGHQFESAAEAAKETYCHASNILRVCKGDLKTSAGFSWRYL